VRALSGARASLAALFALIVLACLLAAGSWRVYTNTWDEPEHLAAGVELLDRGQYEYDTEHPPLARVFLAFAPYLAGAHSYGTPPPDGTREGIDILYADGHYWRFLTLARLGTLPFLALLLVATWLWARRWFTQPWLALLPVLFLMSVPAVLGNAALATLDVAAAATTLFALYFLHAWLASGRARDAVLCGLTAGIAVGTKFSAVPFLALALLALALVQSVVRTRGDADGVGAWWGRRGAGVLLAALAALVPLFIVYGPRTANPAGDAFRFNWAVGYLMQRPGADHLAGVLLSHLWLPRQLEDLVNGIVAVKAHNDTGHLSYLLGETRSTGWWYFYLVAFAVKTPLPLLAAGPWGLIWQARNGWKAKDSWALAPLVITLAILLFCCVFSRINIGIRHVLVLYPFLALGATYLAVRAWHALTALGSRRGVTPGLAALAALIVWQLSPLWRAYPDYLPWFNEAVRHPADVLVDSDLDWGQDLHRLEVRAAQLHIRQLNLAYRGTADLAREPLPAFTVLPPHQVAHGWVAVSELARTRNHSDYAWLEAFRPLERIGKSIDLYYVP
jgi:hypothetical protein